MKNMKTKKKRIKSRISAALAAGPIDDIVRAIKDDHRDLKKFIKTMKDEEATPAEKRDAAESFTGLLKSHAPSEEKALYELCLKVPSLRVMADEGYIGHAVAANLMRTLSGVKNRDRWLAQVKVLAELVEHHIEEEESEFLPEVEKHFGDRKQEEMAKNFYALRKRTQRAFSDDNAGVLRTG